MKKLLKVFAVILVAFTLFSTVGCSDSNYSFWEVKRYENSSGDALTYYCVFKFNKTDRKNVKEIWVNIDSLSKDEVKISHVFGYSKDSTSSRASTTSIKKTNASDADGWVRLLQTDDTGLSYDYVKISLNDGMRFNEIVFVDIEDKVIPANLVTYGERASETSTSKREFTLEQLQAEVEENGLENTALNLNDEQDKFVLETVRKLFEAANPQSSSPSSSN